MHFLENKKGSSGQFSCALNLTLGPLSPHSPLMACPSTHDTTVPAKCPLGKWEHWYPREPVRKVGGDWKGGLNKERGKGREWGPGRTLIAQKPPFCGWGHRNDYRFTQQTFCAASALSQALCQALEWPLRVSLSESPGLYMYLSMVSSIQLYLRSQPLVHLWKPGLPMGSDYCIHTEKWVADNDWKETLPGVFTF